MCAPMHFDWLEEIHRSLALMHFILHQQWEDEATEVEYLTESESESEYGDWDDDLDQLPSMDDFLRGIPQQQN